MEKENKLYSSDRIGQNGKNDVRSRFCKYKTHIQRAKSYNSEDKLQHIFSHLSYKSVLRESSVKDGSNSIIDRLSTIESDLDFSQEEIAVEIKNTSSAQDQQIKKLQKPLQPDKNHKKPLYIQQFNRLNSITPNHYHPKFSLKQQMLNLNLLIKEGLKAIHHVFGCALRIGNKSSKLNVFPSTDYNKLTLNYFLNSKWQKSNPETCIIQIKPIQPYKSTLDFNQILSQLDLLLSKTSRYELAASLTQQIDFNLYLKIREHLFEVEERLLNCSNSLYSLWNSNQYPDFYYMYLKIIKSQQGITREEKLFAIQQFRKLWEINQPLTCSEVGRQVWSKLHE